MDWRTKHQIFDEERKGTSMKKKRSKLQWLACLLVAAVMMTAGAPTVSVRAEEVAELDLIPDEPNEIGPKGTGDVVNKAPAYANVPWYANTGNAANTGRGANNITPNTSATGNHVVYKANATTGQVTNYTLYKVNPQNPTGFDEVLRYDGIGRAEVNKVTGQVLMPHVHDKTAVGDVRTPYFNEIP